MSADSAEQQADDAVELLIDRYGVEDAENRLLYCLSQVRKAKAEEARR